MTDFYDDVTVYEISGYAYHDREFFRKHAIRMHDRSWVDEKQNQLENSSFLFCIQLFASNFHSCGKIDGSRCVSPKN